ncbi:uncharacterized protein KD926_003390 [Aspergillus affinis]|uniref:uncharacterized protein n=1 Tax=Aspergillus affinis TaxID=1070780 RepID=UPI0022FF1D0E|nr:uncharacterized protein KD926_003390 [Aspergillus affinis]KAI9043620.1 hypothetical protein KD926_003390 [Aspergillus affinis]
MRQDRAKRFTCVINLDNHDNKEIKRAVLPKTEAEYEKTLEIFDQFLELYPTARSHPDIQTYKAFLEFVTRNTDGRIEEKPAPDTIESFRRHFEAGLARNRDFHVPQNMSTTMKECRRVKNQKDKLYLEELKRQRYLQQNSQAGSVYEYTLFLFYRRIMPERELLARILPTRSSIRSPTGRKAILALEAICREHHQVAFRSSLQPVDRGCICVKSLDRLYLYRQWLHLYLCMSKALRLMGDDGFAEFCFECGEWFNNQQDWHEHCETHLCNPGNLLRCDPILVAYQTDGTILEYGQVVEPRSVLPELQSSTRRLSLSSSGMYPSVWVVLQPLQGDFWDGALGFPNPTELAGWEALRLWPGGTIDVAISLARPIRLDNADSIEEQKHYVQCNPQICQDLVGAATALLTSSFYFQLDRPVLYNLGVYYCQGSIHCRGDYRRVADALTELNSSQIEFLTQTEVLTKCELGQDICSVCHRYRKHVSFSVRHPTDLITISIRIGNKVTRKISGFPQSISWFQQQQGFDDHFGSSCHDIPGEIRCMSCAQPNDFGAQKRKVAHPLFSSRANRMFRQEDVAHDKLTTWEVEYLDVLKDIPETLRKDLRSSNYRPSHKKRDRKTHNTRSRGRCQPDESTPKHSSPEGSGSDQESQLPSAAAASRSRLSCSRGNNRQSTKGSERTRAGRDKKQTSRKDRHSTRPYCTIACIRGMVNREPLGHKCPNWKLHGSHRHSMGPQDFTRQLHRQLTRDRNHGFDQLHVCGRTGYLMKATLLSHGYTVVIKATTVEKQHRLQAEVDNYHHLRSLQGQHIPMMILGWSGTRLQRVINDGNFNFFHQERDKALAMLRSYGVVHSDSEWRNMLWDDLGGRLVVIDLEEVKWLNVNRGIAENVICNADEVLALTAAWVCVGLMAGSAEGWHYYMQVVGNTLHEVDPNMIPKFCYLVVYLLVALVAAGPVGKQGGTQGQAAQSKPKPSKYKDDPSFDSLGKLGVKEMEFTSIGKSRFNGYASHLKLKSSSVSEADIAGLAEAAWWEMFSQARTDKAKLNKLPTVMTALKVGDEVFLASSLKGGGYIYDKSGLSKLVANPGEQRDKKEEFTSVLKDSAKDVMDALISCREGSIATTEPEQTSAPEKRGPTGKGPRKGGSTSSDKDKKTGTGPNNGQGQRNYQGGSTNPNKSQGQSSNGQGQSNNQGGSSTTGSNNPISEDLVKHKNEGACGEIMASLEYSLLNPTKPLKNLPEQPTVVAWAEVLEKVPKNPNDRKSPKMITGEVLKTGGIKPPCDNTIWNPKDLSQHGKSLTDEDGCGEGWGCAAFVGPKGLNFKVVDKKPTYLKKDQIEVLKDVPKFPVPK